MSAYVRQPLYLAVDNPTPRRREDSLGYRMGTLAAFVGAAAFAVLFWWSVADLIRTMFFG